MTPRAAATATPAPALDVELLRLLADPTRAAIVSLLAREQLCTCHMVTELGTSQTNVSNHLRLLREAGLVATEPCGRFTYYRLLPGALARLATQLGAVAAAASRMSAVRRPCS